MIPAIIPGGSHKDSRGTLNYNNSFNLSQVTAASGRFEIQLILIDNWKTPSVDLKRTTFELVHDTLDVLHIPPGYICSIQSLTNNSKLLIMSDYELNEAKDEYRFPVDYFKKK
jgi:hypothetical protein